MNNKINTIKRNNKLKNDSFMRFRCCANCEAAGDSGGMA
jgi:hypothetical protein